MTLSLPVSTPQLLEQAKASIPEQWRELPIYITFRLSMKDNGRIGKEPLIPGTNRHASSTDPRTHRPLEVALADCRRRGLFLGFSLPAGHTLVDEDGVINQDGVIAPATLARIRQLNSLTVRTVSGTGTHTYVAGAPPENATKPEGVELYAGKRFVLWTGDIIDPFTTIAERSDALAERFPPAAPSDPIPAIPLTVDDHEVLRLLRSFRNAPDFERSWSGDASKFGGDQSRNDQALASYIAFVTQDRDQILRLIRQSLVWDAKWERPDYQKRTLDRALNRSDFYTPGAPIIESEYRHHGVSNASSKASAPEPYADHVAALEAENAILRATIAERDATITALVQTMLSPHLTHTEKIGAINIARHAHAKLMSGQAESDGRVVISPSEVSDDWRPKPEPGEHLSPVNPDSGTAPHMPRSSARAVLDTALERGLIDGEKRGAIRRRADGSTYKDWEYLVSPAASFAALLDPWATWRPDQPKVRKVRESHACQHCGELHGITRVDYCGTDTDPGCGGEVARRQIDLETPPIGEFISPIRTVADKRHGRTFPSHSTPSEPDWLADMPDPWDASPQRSLFPIGEIISPTQDDLSSPGSSYHFSAD